MTDTIYIVWLTACKIIIFGLCVERRRLLNANKFYKRYIAQKLVEVTSIEKQLKEILENQD